MNNFMRVFHFINKEHGFDDIKNSRIKIATINKLNDPFEFYVNFTSLGEPLEEEYLDRVKDHYDKILGFLCFSEWLENPVQWAHYADNHNGICLEFEVPLKNLVKVEYRETPLTIESGDIDWRKKFVAATESKYKHWCYEREYRTIINLESAECIIRNGELLFMPFSEDLVLMSVYTGLHCKLSESDKMMLKDKGVDLFGTVKDRNSFSIVKA